MNICEGSHLKVVNHRRVGDHSSDRSDGEWHFGREYHDLGVFSACGGGPGISFDLYKLRLLYWKASLLSPIPEILGKR